MRPAEDAIPRLMSCFDLTGFRDGDAVNPGNTTPVEPTIGGDLGATPGGTMPTRGGANAPRAAFVGLAALNGIGIIRAGSGEMRCAVWD